MRAVQNIPAFLGILVVFCGGFSFSQALQQNFVRVGCYKDSMHDRALPDLIINHRVTHPIIDWSNLSKTIYSCAKAAQDKGYVYFALQFYGECWAGHSGHLTYDKHGLSTDCEKGVGKGHTNYVYRNTGLENECESFKALSSENRAITFTTKLSKYLCDKDMTPGWYRFEGKAGNKMADACSTNPQSTCGAQYEGWLKGSYPQPSEGITAAKVCFNYARYKNCCVREENIKIRNCGRFYVYQLKPPSVGCFSRYCGNGL